MNNSYMLYSTLSEIECDEGNFELVAEESLPRFAKPPLDYYSANFPNTTSTVLENGKTVHI
jgi:hypothetical protein